MVVKINLTSLLTLLTRLWVEAKVCVKPCCVISMGVAPWPMGSLNDSPMDWAVPCQLGQAAVSTTAGLPTVVDLQAFTSPDLIGRMPYK